MSSFGDDDKRSIDLVHDVSDYARHQLSRAEMDDVSVIKLLLDYWDERSAGGSRIPSRKDINPVDLKPILSHLVLFDLVFDDGKLVDSKPTLIGTELTKVYGEVTGQLTSETQNDYVIQTVLGATDECIRLRRPVAMHAKAVSAEMPFTSSYALYCPLATNHSDIDKVMIQLAFYRRD